MQGFARLRRVVTSFISLLLIAVLVGHHSFPRAFRCVISGILFSLVADVVPRPRQPGPGWLPGQGSRLAGLWWRDVTVHGSVQKAGDVSPNARRRAPRHWDTWTVMTVTTRRVGRAP